MSWAGNVMKGWYEHRNVLSGPFACWSLVFRCMHRAAWRRRESVERATCGLNRRTDGRVHKSTASKHVKADMHIRIITSGIGTNELNEGFLLPFASLSAGRLSLLRKVCCSPRHGEAQVGRHPVKPLSPEGAVTHFIHSFIHSSSVSYERMKMHPWNPHCMWLIGSGSRA